ncbi:MAG TPA: cytochrome P460 family protein [Pyrinomonadaceae bacterium]
MVIGPVGGGIRSGISISQGTTRIFNRREFTPDSSSKSINVDHLGLGPVFVNETALQTIESKATAYPEGSILVREKPSKSSDKPPQLLSVMIKHEAGFNPAGGDWEFLLINGPGTKVKLSQKTGECLNCHVTQKQTDFVYPLKK